MEVQPRPVVALPEPDLVLVRVTPRLTLRVLVIGDMTWSGWWLDGEPATEPLESGEA